VGDGAGAIFIGNSVISHDSFRSFFDFGDKARVFVNYLHHRREDPLIVRHCQSSHKNLSVSSVHNGSFLDIEGPGIVEILSSPYLEMSFDFVIGSKIRIPSEFSNSPIVGSVVEIGLNQTGGVVVDWGSANVTWFITAAPEKEFWRYVAWVMVAVTAAITAVSSVVLILIVKVDYWSEKKCCQDIDKQQNSLITDIHAPSYTEVV
jgi:hypothetical protein